MAAPLPRPLRILDLGGRSGFWQRAGWAGRDDVQITLINVEPEPRRYHNIEPRVGDATCLADLDDKSFDVAFSNSVIEHVGTLDDQRAMAGEVQRVGRAWWVQTPNFWFPMEPHFLVPGWQWMPRALRVELLHRLPLPGGGPCRDRLRAGRRVDAIRLLTRRELRALFPGSTIRAERVGGIVKSWVACGGFPTLA